MIPFIYKKPKPKACDPLGQESGSCRDTELVAAEQRPALVPLLGLPAHLSAQWGKQSLLSLPPTRNNPPVSRSCVFSQPQGSCAALPNQSLRHMVPPQVQGKHTEPHQQAHTQDLV